MPFALAASISAHRQMCVSVGEPSRNRQFLGRSQSSGQGNNELVIHLRVVSPPDVTQTLMPALQADPTVMNLTVLTGAVSNPDGDALLFDVPQGAANQVIGRLRDGGVDQRGSIMLENVDTSISALADQVSARRGRFQQFTPVWAEIESRIGLEGTYPPSWFTLLVIAGLIGAVGILTNSQILIVGAMVVGPEYGAILSLSFGVTRKDFARVARSATALGIGFALAVVGALLLALIVRWAGLESAAYAAGVRPVSNLINTPNWFSFIVAALAGVVGVVSLTEARSSTLIGVFISVTTIPAASDIGVSAAFGSRSEAWGSTLQLLLNVAVLTAVAILGLPAQRALWRRLERRTAEAQPSQHPAQGSP
jgi:uncharacterized hydrophobic protein (TIGR00271 family)